MARRVRGRERNTSDGALVRSFGAGDPAAADALYDRYAPRIYGLGLVMLGDGAAAEDLVQDAFVKLFRGADRFDADRGSLSTWVLLNARSLAIDALRRRVLDARLADQIGPVSQADEGPGPEAITEAADLVDRARTAMAGLSPGQRAALELAYFGGKTSAEVAELEGIPLGTAKTRIRAALLRLRQVLEESDEV